jgi:uncharacterized membrane-anchored protein YhcB (DUF1043 family)
MMDWPISAILLAWPVALGSVVLGLKVVGGSPSAWKFWGWSAASWGAIAGIITGAGLIFFAYRTWRFQKVQLAGQDRALKSATYSTIQGRVIDVNKYLVAKPDLVMAITQPYAQVAARASDAAAAMTPMFPQAEAFADVLLSLFEELYYQHFEYDLVNEEIWESWTQLMKGVLNEYVFLRGHLESGTTHFSEKFRYFLLHL